MNRRDSIVIAQALARARQGAIFHAQSAATSWFFCIEAVADALSDRDPGFNRGEFLAACRAAPEPAQDDTKEPA